MGAEWSKCIPNPSGYSGIETPETAMDDLVRGIQLMESQQRAHEHKAAERKMRAAQLKNKDKAAAITALREAKQYTAISSRVSGQKMVLEQVKSTLETAAISQDIAEVLSRCTVALKGMTKGVDLSSVDTIMAQLGDQAQDVQEISEAVSTPLDVGEVAVDDDSLWEELMGMEEVPDSPLPPFPPPPVVDENKRTELLLAAAPSPPSRFSATAPGRERTLPTRPRLRGAPSRAKIKKTTSSQVYQELEL